MNSESFMNKFLTEFKENVAIQDRKYNAITYKKCFIASEAIDWFCYYLKLHRKTAEFLGELLYFKRKIMHVTDANNFRDEFLYFKINENEEEEEEN